MKCKCGYEGWAEIGNFPDERFGGKYKDMNTPYRCPKCKSNKNILYIDAIDRIRKVLILGEICRRNIPYPHKAKKKVEFITGGADNSTVGYSIYCPICGWGEGSAIKLEDYEKLVNEAKSGKFILVQKDVDEELRKIMGD